MTGQSRATMDWPEFLAKAISAFVEHGRDYSGWDCWGLVVCGYRDVLEIELPGYEDWYGRTNDAEALLKAFRHGREFRGRECGRETGAIAVILRRRDPIHVGVVIGEDILHCEPGIGTVLEPIAGLKVESYWRPKCPTET